MLFVSSIYYLIAYHEGKCCAELDDANFYASVFAIILPNFSLFLVVFQN